MSSAQIIITTLQANNTYLRFRKYIDGGKYTWLQMKFKCTHCQHWQMIPIIEWLIDPSVILSRVSKVAAGAEAASAVAVVDCTLL